MAKSAKAPIESIEYAKFIKRSLRAFGRRAGQDVDALTLLRDIGEEYNRVLDEAARECHKTWSWGEIALRLGVTRQAAQKRWGKDNDDMTIAARLEELRTEIRAERISYSEIAELQGLADHIDPDDTELLEWAGVPENERPQP